MSSSTQRGTAERGSLLVALAMAAPMVAIWLGTDDPAAALRFERGRILDGEWWRLLSAHLVHLDALHLAGNLAAILAWGYFFKERESPSSVALRLLTCGLLVSLGVLAFSARIEWMAGASGLIHALVAGSALRLALGRRRTLGAALLAALALKVLAEQVLGLASWMEAYAEYPIVSEAHGYGLAAGVIFELARHARRRARAASRWRVRDMWRKAMAGLATTGLAVAIWLGVGWPPAQAYTEARAPLSALVQRAHTIVVGSVEATEGMERFFGDHLRVVTETLVGELEVVKGEVPAMEMSVIQFGGRVGDVMEWYPGLPVMEVGRRYLIFLIESNGGLLVPLGAQGLIAVVTDPNRGIEVLVSSNGQAVTGIRDDWVEYGAVTSGEPAQNAAALDTAMPLSRFLDEVRSRLN